MVHLAGALVPNVPYESRFRRRTKIWPDRRQVHIEVAVAVARGKLANAEAVQVRMEGIIGKLFSGWLCVTLA